MAEARPINAHLPFFPMGSMTAYGGKTLLCLFHHYALTYAGQGLMWEMWGHNGGNVVQWKESWLRIDPRVDFALLPIFRDLGYITSLSVCHFPLCRMGIKAHRATT